MKNNKLSKAALQVLALAQDHRPDEAVLEADRALAEDPDDADVLVAKGNALDMLGEYERALTCYEQAIALDPAHLLAQFDRADHFAYVDRMPEARDRLTTLLDLIARTRSGEDPVAREVLDDVAFFAELYDLPDLETKVRQVRAALGIERP